MIESLTAVAWAFSTVSAIAQSEPGKKFIEGTIGKVAEMVTEAGVAKIAKLRDLIRGKLQKDKPEALPAWEKAEAGSVEDLRDVVAYLMMLQKDETFAKEVNDLVQDIKSCVVQGNDAMVQNNYDQARGYQIKAETGSKVYFVEKMENPDWLESSEEVPPKSSTPTKLDPLRDKTSQTLLSVVADEVEQRMSQSLHFAIDALLNLPKAKSVFVNKY